MNPIINNPELWLSVFPRPDEDAHKYDRGHAQIVGSQDLTGATRLAAMACARIGAGLVTVIGGKKSDVYRASLPGHILVQEQVSKNQDKITASLIGPGGHPAKADIQRRFPTRHSMVLDAAEIGAGRFAVDDYCVLTPHEGEFERAFPSIKGTREERAVAAAAKTGATIVLKGPQTVIAAPDGQLIINTHSTPYLATAGTGDVLAGMITGLSAQGMHPFIAACAAVWIHGEAGRWVGPGLVASDLPDMIPAVLARLLNP
jgi:NAD(P)H-hydrate epimerase